MRAGHLLITHYIYALRGQLSILSRLSSQQILPTLCLTPTRLPARIQMWQLSITLRMLPIRSHALRKLHLLDFSLRYARDKSGVAFTRKPARIDSYFIQKNKTHILRCVFYFLTGSYLSSQAASSQVLSTYKGLTTVFGMGTGGSP